MDNYFNLCNIVCARGPCNEAPPYYFCVFDLGVLFAVACLFTFIVLCRLILRHRSPVRFSFTEIFRHSIFQCLENLRPRSSFFLYLAVTYGIFFIRPFGSLVFLLIVNYTDLSESWNINISIVMNAVISSFYFFTVIFMVNFYGVKAEIIRSSGDPSIKASEREFFLMMVLRRSEKFSIIFFLSSLIGVLLKNPSFAMFPDSSHHLYGWVFRTLAYSFLFTMVIHRLYYVTYTRKMVKLYAIKKKKIFNVVSFTQHVQSNLVTHQMLDTLIDQIDATEEEEFINEFEKTIVQQCGRSSYIFNSTRNIINSTQENYQPIIRNPMENYLAGGFWLYFTVIDSVFNAAASAMLLLTNIIEPDSVDNPEENNAEFGIAMTMFGLYILETIFQSALVYIIVTNKANLGDHIEADSSRTVSVDVGDIQFDIRGVPDESRDLTEA